MTDFLQTIIDLVLNILGYLVSFESSIVIMAILFVIIFLVKMKEFLT